MAMVSEQKYGAKSFFFKLPKAELHLHLEGTVPYSTLAVLEEKYNQHIPRPNTDYTYEGIRDFIANWRSRNSLLRDYEDFTLAAEAVSRELQKDGIVYAELHISPGSFVAKHGLDPQRLIQSIQTGLAKTPEVQCNLIIDLVRDQGVERGSFLLDQSLEIAKQANIVAIGLGGTEGDFPVEGYARLFKKAREHGLKTVAHAGESAGPESIWSVIRLLDVDRIGHGLTCLQDPELVSYLEHTQLPLEVCVTSNSKLKAIETPNAHPLPIFLEQGLNMTLSSDDPAMFNTSLSQECHLLTRELGFPVAKVTALLRNSFQAAFISEQQKSYFLERFDRIIETLSA